MKVVNLSDYEYIKNLDILKNYVDVLSNSNDINLNNILLKYAIIIHNFIILELIFDIIKKNNYIINKHLSLRNTNNEYLINNILFKYYDPENIVRNNIEKMNYLKKVNDFLNNNSDIYNRLYTIDEINIIIDTNNYNL